MTFPSSCALTASSSTPSVLPIPVSLAVCRLLAVLRALRLCREVSPTRSSCLEKRPTLMLVGLSVWCVVVDMLSRCAARELEGCKRWLLLEGRGSGKEGRKEGREGQPTSRAVSSFRGFNKSQSCPPSTSTEACTSVGGEGGGSGGVRRSPAGEQLPPVGRGRTPHLRRDRARFCWQVERA